MALSPASVHDVTRNAFAANLYPNPGKDNFTIEVSTGEMLSLNVYDQTGKLVIEGLRFNSKITVADHRLATGIYTAKLSNDEGKSTILRFEVTN